MKTDKFVACVKAAGITPKVIFDVGAYTGEQAIELANAFPEALVFAFEADWELACRAYLNCAVSPRITVLNMAITSRDGLAMFHKATGRNKECGSLLKPNGKYFEPMPTAPMIVCTHRLSTVIEELGIQAPCIMWMDVQGAELLALEGMGAAINQLKMLWTEVAYSQYYENQIKSEELQSELEIMGFVKVTEEVGIPGWFGDVCFKSK